MSDSVQEQGLPAGAGFHAIMRRLPGILLAHRRLFLITFSCVALGAVAGTYAKRQMYESNAKLLVKLEQRGVSLSQSEVRYEQSLKIAEEAVTTQAELLSSKDIIGRVVDELGADILEGPPPSSWFGKAVRAAVRGVTEGLEDALAALGLVVKMAPRDATVAAIQKNLKIYPVRRAQLIEVSFRARNPLAAPRVLDSFIQLQLKKLAELNAVSEGYEFYREQTQQLNGALRVAESEWAEFKAKHLIIDIQAEKSMLMQRIERLTSLLEGSQAGAAVDAGPATPVREVRGGEAENRGLPTPLRDAGASLAGNELSQLVARLNELKLEHARRTTLFERHNPLVQELENQIASAESMLGREARRRTESINTYKARLAKLDRLEPESRRLLRNATISEENYKTFARATEDRRIAQQEQNKVVILVVDKPSTPDKPVPPSRLIILLIGLALALVAGMLAVLVVEWSRMARLGQSASSATGV